MQGSRGWRERIRGFLGTLIAVLLGLGIGGVVALRSEPTASDLVVPAPTSTEAPSPTVRVVPAPGQTLISGTVTTAALHGVVGAPLTTPFTLAPRARGEGGARIEGITVGGAPSTLVWDGGQPLDLRGSGSLAPGSLAVDVDGAALHWHLDGAARTLTAGRYETAATVAVGASGLATPRDGVAFEVPAGGAATIQTHGDVTATTPPADLHVEGPGTVDLAGTLVVRTAGGERQAKGLSTAEGAFVLSLSPAGGGRYTVDAVLQSPVTVR